MPSSRKCRRIVVMRQISAVLLRSILAAVFVGVHAGVLPAGADEPGSWEPFKVCSESGQYCAGVAAIDGNVEEPRNRNYHLTITRNSGGGELEIWSSPYHYDGYPGGIISSDGMTFVYVNYWFYADTAVVRIYREDHLLDLVGAVFKIPESKLIDTVSHQLWLSERRPAYKLLDEERLQIQTIDGKKPFGSPFHRVVRRVTLPPNKALQLTANPLRGLSAAELCRALSLDSKP